MILVRAGLGVGEAWSLVMDMTEMVQVAVVPAAGGLLLP